MAENYMFGSNTIKFSSTIDESKFTSVGSTNASSEGHSGILKEYYDLAKCVQCIRDYNFAKIALQFPDSQLSDASKVAQMIEDQANCKAYILADTSYGSCCVDEIAAEHVKADLIIHFGPACLSPTERVPVLFVFGKEPIDIDSCCQSLKNSTLDKNCRILIIYDVVYHHAIDEVYTRLALEYKYIIRASVNCPDPGMFYKKQNDLHVVQTSEEAHSPHDHEFKGSGRCVECDCFASVPVKNKFSELSITIETGGGKKYRRFGRKIAVAEGLSIEDYTVFYIGKESLTLTNHMMTYNKCQFYTYNPVTNVFRKETLNVNRMLMKRYYLIEKAKDSQVVGILIATLGKANYLSAITRIKKILRQSGKKFYTFVVGKLNAEKLANFMEIDIFVLIACPENSLINSQDFYKPIVTPFEIEIACTRARQWTGEYITDFQELLPGAAHHVEIGNQMDEEDQVPDFSLISGRLRPNLSSRKDVKDVESTSLATRNQDTTVSTQDHTTAGEFLAKRSWKGLDPAKGETSVSKAVEGREGIAAEYKNEPNVNNKGHEVT